MSVIKSRMQILASAFYLVLVCGISAAAQTGTDEIEWSTAKLSWSDFKGTPKAMRAVAMTNSGIYFNYGQSGDGTLNFTIVSNFDKKQSWVKPEGRKDEVLRHEQLHFDISELHARLLRKYFTEQSFPARKNLGGVIKRYYKEQIQELNRMQNKYDSETNNGTRAEAQKKWEERVALELKKLDAFTQHIIVRRVVK
ncbi:MAG: DUF922 domain-containing protein [Bacteroidia bacterium]|nr:DUF922 domain-containing protein [Bacteroidia bacterium]